MKITAGTEFMNLQGRECLLGTITSYQNYDKTRAGTFVELATATRYTTEYKYGNYQKRGV